MKSPYLYFRSCFVVYGSFNAVLVTFFVTRAVSNLNWLVTRCYQSIKAGNFNRSRTPTVATRRPINSTKVDRSPLNFQTQERLVISGKSFQIPLHRSEWRSVLPPILATRNLFGLTTGFKYRSASEQIKTLEVMDRKVVTFALFSNNTFLGFVRVIRLVAPHALQRMSRRQL